MLIFPNAIFWGVILKIFTIFVPEKASNIDNLPINEYVRTKHLDIHVKSLRRKGVYHDQRTRIIILIGSI